MNAILDQTFPSTATSAASLSSGVSPGILYVEDDEMIRSIYGEILLQAGYSADLARDGLAGWEALQRKEIRPADYRPRHAPNDGPGGWRCARVAPAWSYPSSWLPATPGSRITTSMPGFGYPPACKSHSPPDDLLQSVEAALHRSAKNQVALPRVECAVSDNASATQRQGPTFLSLVTISK